jgi:potassium efflux system protein
MRELLHEISGWLGYLQRPWVVAQLLAVALLLTLHLLSHRRGGGGQGLREWGRPLLLLGSVALVAAGLAAFGMPSGILLQSLALIAGWYGLSLVRRLLAPLIAPRELSLLDSRLIRPLYLLFALMTMIAQVDSPADLAVIPVGTWFGTSVTLGHLLATVLIVYVLAMGTGPPAHGLAWLLQKGTGVSDGSRRAMALMIRYAVVGIGIVWALDRIGFNRTAILAVAGGLSVGLGFGIKEVFANFVSGLWLLFEGSVRPGEVLFIDGNPCEVRSLGLRSAVLWRDLDNAELLIPNQTFFTATITTYTGSDRLRRSQIVVGAAYRHDPREVIALLEATARTCPGVLPEPAPKGLLVSYGDSSVLYSLRFWIADPMNNAGICSEVQMAVWHAFRDNDIEIPFPQQVQYQVEGVPEGSAERPLARDEGSA